MYIAFSRSTNSSHKICISGWKHDRILKQFQGTPGPKGRLRHGRDPRGGSEHRQDLRGRRRSTNHLAPTSANVQSQKEQEKEAWSPLRRPALLLLQLLLRLCRCSIIITLVGLESCRLLQFHDRFWSCKLFFRDTSGKINAKNSVSVNKMALEASIFAADKLLLQSCRVLEF